MRILKFCSESHKPPKMPTLFFIALWFRFLFYVSLWRTIVC